MTAEESGTATLRLRLEEVDNFLILNTTGLCFIVNTVELCDNVNAVSCLHNKTTQCQESDNSIKNGKKFDVHYNIYNITKMPANILYFIMAMAQDRRQRNELGACILICYAVSSSLLTRLLTRRFYTRRRYRLEDTTTQWP